MANLAALEERINEKIHRHAAKLKEAREESYAIDWAGSHSKEWHRFHTRNSAHANAIEAYQNVLIWLKYDPDIAGQDDNDEEEQA